MKKNLLMLMFVFAFICVGVSVASAKNSSSFRSSSVVSKRLSPAKNISNNINALKAKCKVGAPCQKQLDDLIQANIDYVIQCSPNYIAGCAPVEEQQLLYYADVYEACLWWNGYLD